MMQFTLDLFIRSFQTRGFGFASLIFIDKNIIFASYFTMLIAPWFCDGCGRQNGMTRYQCQHCRGLNTYDLCEQCILHASAIHPNHVFHLVQQAGTGTTNWTVGQTPPISLR